jgi:penicillin amidase
VFEVLLYHLANLLYPRAILLAYSSAWILRDLIRADLEAMEPPRLRRVARRALRRASQAVRHRTWGDLHRLSLGYPLSALPLFGRRYRNLYLPTAGGSETIMKMAGGLVGGRHTVQYGSNARFIADLSNLDETYVVLLGGQDGWLGSTTFADQVSLWHKGRYIRLPLSAERACADFPNVTRLSPASAGYSSGRQRS